MPATFRILITVTQHAFQSVQAIPQQTVRHRRYLALVASSDGLLDFVFSRC